MKPATDTLTAIIVDDEKDAIEVLQDTIRSHCSEVVVIGSASSAQEGLELLDEKQPDILFLDIQMPRESGFDLLRNATSDSFQTIFVSAHESHAVEAVKFHAMAYLLKPVGATELCEAVQLVRESSLEESRSNHEALLFNLQQNTSKRIAVPTGKGHRYFDTDEIIRVEAAKNYSNVYTTESPKPILVSRNLKQFENLLSQRGFVRVHNAHVVNVGHIREYTRQDGGGIILSDGLALLIGRRYREGVLASLRQRSESL